MNPKITPIPNQKRLRKAILEARLTEALRISGQRENLDIEYQADPIDQVRAGVDRDITVEQLKRQTRLSQEIRTALKKLDGNLYGVCEACEEPIAQQRLAAIPWARLCVKCQSRAEAQEREGEQFGHAA